LASAFKTFPPGAWLDLDQSIALGCDAGNQFHLTRPVTQAGGKGVQIIRALKGALLELGSKILFFRSASTALDTFIQSFEGGAVLGVFVAGAGFIVVNARVGFLHLRTASALEAFAASFSLSIAQNMPSGSAELA
jgi:hypothetical protein